MPRVPSPGCSCSSGSTGERTREHPAFPEQDLVNQIALRDPAGWTGPLDVIDSLGAYYTRRAFAWVLMLGVLAWLPWFEADRKTKLVCTWLVAVSLVVLLIPIRFGSVSVWRLFFERLPGFGVIRDPKRVIYLFELAVVIAGALLLARLPARSPYRRCAAALLVLLIAAVPNLAVLGSYRPIDTFARWVEAPIAFGATCRSFFVKGASATYMSRSSHMATLYAIDAMFVALNHSIPTLNGYSAWSPDGWDLQNPQAPGYERAVQRWIARHDLREVCELDLDARTMTAVR